VTDIYSNWELSADRANAARRVTERSGLHAGQARGVRGYADRQLRRRASRRRTDLHSMDRDHTESLRSGAYRARPRRSMMLPAMTYPSRVNPGNPAVDPEAIEQLRFLEDEDQPNVVAELVLLFVEHTPPKIAAIRDGLAQGDAGAVKRAAHSLKGSSANVGATGMQHVCEQIEHAAAGGDLGPARELLPLLEQEVAVVVEALQAEL
jgi:HPt (histidine-containing phosphotransfer) domain-containing protein